MAHAEAAAAVAEGTQDPNSDAHSAVYLLEVDSINDLHNVPLDADQPPGPEDCNECVTTTAANKEVPVTVEPRINLDTINNYIFVVFFTLLGISLLIVLGNLIVLVYMWLRNDNQDKVIEALTQTLLSQANILRQVMANQHNAGNTGGK